MPRSLRTGGRAQRRGGGPARGAQRANPSGSRAACCSPGGLHGGRRWRPDRLHHRPRPLDAAAPVRRVPQTPNARRLPHQHRSRRGRGGSTAISGPHRRARRFLMFQVRGIDLAVRAHAGPGGGPGGRPSRSRAGREARGQSPATACHLAGPPTSRSRRGGSANPRAPGQAAGRAPGRAGRGDRARCRPAARPGAASAPAPGPGTAAAAASRASPRRALGGIRRSPRPKRAPAARARAPGRTRRRSRTRAPGRPTRRARAPIGRGP